MRRRFETLDTFAKLLGDQAREFYGIRPGSDRMLTEGCTDLFVATGEAAVAPAREP